MTDTTIRRYTSEEEGDEESRADETQGEQVVCPECSGNLVSDGEQGETVCEDCGLVVDEDEIDPGPGGVRSTPRRKTRSPASAPRRPT